jgi:hypothetical protein
MPGGDLMENIDQRVETGDTLTVFLSLHGQTEHHKYKEKLRGRTKEHITV